MAAFLLFQGYSSCRITIQSLETSPTIFSTFAAFLKTISGKPVSIQENIEITAGLTNAGNQQVMLIKWHWHSVWHYVVPVFNLLCENFKSTKDEKVFRNHGNRYRFNLLFQTGISTTGGRNPKHVFPKRQCCRTKYGSKTNCTQHCYH